MLLFLRPGAPPAGTMPALTVTLTERLRAGDSGWVELTADEAVRVGEVLTARLTAPITPGVLAIALSETVRLADGGRAVVAVSPIRVQDGPIVAQLTAPIEPGPDLAVTILERVRLRQTLTARRRRRPK